MLKSLQVKLQQFTWSMNFQILKFDLDKAVEPEIKLPTSTGSQKKKENSKKTSTSALLNMAKAFDMWITTTVENS